MLRRRPLPLPRRQLRWPARQPLRSCGPATALPRTLALALLPCRGALPDRRSAPRACALNPTPCRPRTFIPRPVAALAQPLARAPALEGTCPALGQRQQRSAAATPATPAIALRAPQRPMAARVQQRGAQTAPSPSNLAMARVMTPQTLAVTQGLGLARAAVHGRRRPAQRWSCWQTRRPPTRPRRLARATPRLCRCISTLFKHFAEPERGARLLELYLLRLLAPDLHS